MNRQTVENRYADKMQKKLRQTNKRRDPGWGSAPPRPRRATALDPPTQGESIDQFPHFLVSPEVGRSVPHPALGAPKSRFGRWGTSPVRNCWGGVVLGGVGDSR